LDHQPGIGRLAARYDAAMMTQVQQNAVCNAAHKAEGRISRCLLELHDRYGAVVLRVFGGMSIT
jgi:hypothetical protein